MENDAKQADVNAAILRAVRLLLHDIDAGKEWPVFVSYVSEVDSTLRDPSTITDPTLNAVWNFADSVADAVGHGFRVVDHGIPVSEAIELLRQIAHEEAWTLETKDARIAKFRWPKARRQAGSG